MFLVVFRNRKRVGIDRAAYDAQAAAMEELAERQPGYRAFKSYTAHDGEAVSISEWDDEASARAWGRVAEHRLAQTDGKERWYAEYTLSPAMPRTLIAFAQRTELRGRGRRAAALWRAPQTPSRKAER